MSRIPVALQLFSVRGECQNDVAATLKSIAEIGYVAAEPWGYRGEAVEWMGHGADVLRQMYDDAGLKCCGMHIATQALQGDSLSRTVELNKTLGNKFLIIAGDKQRMETPEGVAELAGILNDTALKLEEEGMMAGYHAHPFDFVTHGGQTAWDLLFSSTSDEVVMQMDNGNCAGGGGDPVAIMKKFPGRVRSMHLKEFGGPEGAVIGEGDMDWPETFRICEEDNETEWYVVEEGGPDGLGFDVCKRSFEALRAMGKC
ncbi:MAG: TIM barrel protein [Planctomycetota bacterium]|nr:TIM barrel protein [Planctomycetota bacterium]